MKKVVTFGEIMMRLSPPNNLRFTQATSYDAVFGGGEANVVISLSNYGIPVDYVTRLPENEIGKSVNSFLIQKGVGTQHVLWGGERLGLYFLEKGASLRASKVIYDRASSSISEVQPEMVDWADVFQGAQWFHWTGITPALSKGAAETCLEAVKKASELGLMVSGDPNYRKGLWNYTINPNEVLQELVSYSDVVVANEWDSPRLLGDDHIPSKNHEDDFKSFCEHLKSKYSRVKHITTTKRGSVSASFNTLKGYFHTSDKIYQTKTYEIVPIVDRVGGGDAFMGGLIYGMISHQDNPQKTIDFAVAASALKHTIQGDANEVSVDEVEGIANGDVSGKVDR